MFAARNVYIANIWEGKALHISILTFLLILDHLLDYVKNGNINCNLVIWLIIYKNNK